MDRLLKSAQGILPKKKKRLADVNVVGDDVMTDGDGVLGVDVLPEIFGFLDWHEILRARICRKWKEAATLTLVPPSSEYRCIMEGMDGPREVDMPQFNVTSAAKYTMLSRMREILPGLQQIYLGEFFRDSKDVGMWLMGVPRWALLERGGTGNLKYVEGDPRSQGPSKRRTLMQKLWGNAEVDAYDVSIVAGFQHLRRLHIKGAPLNGKYPSLFGFKELRELRIKDCSHLKWDLGMLAGMPRLAILECIDVDVRGNLQELEVLKSTLRELVLGKCGGVTGDVMDLADFPELAVLDVEDSAVTVEVGQIRATHFPKLQKLFLPGGFDRIADVSSAVIDVFHSLAKRAPYPCMGRVQLSKDSPDRYAAHEWMPSPPFGLEMIKAGTRLGWRWTNLEVDCSEPGSCETNWLDPAPVEGTNEYAEYAKEVEKMEESVKFYKGIFAPPTEAEYRQLCRDADERQIQENHAFHAALESSGLFTSVPAYPGE